jgi:methylated-DNA-[protein]-cysteine S-methyltransferase
MRLAFAELASPIGAVLVAASEQGLCALDFADCRDRMEESLERRFGAFTLEADPRLDEISDRIAGYFAGDLDALAGIRTDLGGTPFQARVWAALSRIPPGPTSSYRELATAIGQPSASRAVGAANGRNPVALVIPCHRVIGADGSLTGYAGGIERKRWLLDHEARSLARPDAPTPQLRMAEV